MRDMAAYRREGPDYRAPFVTERLTLRPFSTDDFAPFMDFLTSERGRWHGAGPEAGIARAWRSAAMFIGHWEIFGWGTYVYSDTASGEPVGAMGMFFPEEFPEIELGWSVWNPAAEGKGYASEAARAILKRYLGDFGWPTLVSYIDPKNLRSTALAERLGATVDADACGPDPEDRVYRHSLEALL